MSENVDEVYLLFGEFAEYFGNTSIEEFRMRFPHPFLEVQIKKGVYETRDALSAVQTHVGSETVYQEEGDVDWKKAVIVQVKKTKRNAVPKVMTAGRMLKNDVILPHESVSKLHAYFKRGPTNVYTLQDAGSKFGTTVNGHALAEGVPAPLESSMEIIFGRHVRALFFDPIDFHKYMRLKMRTGQTRRRRP